MRQTNRVRIRDGTLNVQIEGLRYDTNLRCLKKIIGLFAELCLETLEHAETTGSSEMRKPAFMIWPKGSWSSAHTTPCYSCLSKNTSVGCICTDMFKHRGIIVALRDNGLDKFLPQLHHR